MTIVMMFSRWLSRRSGGHYEALAKDAEEGEKIPPLWKISKKQRCPRWLPLSLVLGFLVCMALLSSISVILLYKQHYFNSASCRTPRVRREWRTLKKPEQLAYIEAVQCLQRQPSTLSASGSSYDDFPRTHRGVGLEQHEALSFLSWHRYFIAIFEERLKNDCGYEGSLPYWNWMIDHEDPAASPVFDRVYGFGGNGDVDSDDGEGPVGSGFCVKDGPFAGLIARYVGEKEQPHCLSRNFRNDTSTAHFKGRLLRPELTKDILDEDEILKFLPRLERGPHNTIPQGIGGDFKSFTAPADPLFFLHHGQLDRLWWVWQNRKPERRTLYSGKHSLNTETEAALSDILEMQGLAPDLMVSHIIDTRGGKLCYTYDEAI